MSSLNSHKYGQVVVPDTDLAAPSRGIYVGGAGDVSAIMAGGGTVIFSAVPVGTVLPIRCTQITIANTDATLMIALW